MGILWMISLKDNCDCIWVDTPKREFRDWLAIDSIFVRGQLGEGGVCVLIVQSDRTGDTWCCTLCTERVGEIVYKLETERARGRMGMVGMFYLRLIALREGGGSDTKLRTVT
ncbi:hypothetical protein CEXT_751561 [Caerostris extrusa]|uniref:Uncharacterized protein n=1 Tax=Caerostris extrusa TaxID=172846 RepID=A0AAV4NMM7_CAEEX|nr:hypothetical protein CEXT_751561 [Caerostris extrusa]